MNHDEFLKYADEGLTPDKHGHRGGWLISGPIADRFHDLVKAERGRRDMSPADRLAELSREAAQLAQDLRQDDGYSLAADLLQQGLHIFRGATSAAVLAERVTACQVSEGKCMLAYQDATSAAEQDLGECP
jgi:hypothetical protein